MDPTTLTKTRFTIALECPRKLDYLRDRTYHDARRHDAFLASLAEGGQQVGELARQMYPGGHLITERDVDAQAIATAAWLTQPDVTLFEATIRHQNLLVRCDVLEKHGDEVRLIEVKAKGFDFDEERFMSTRDSGHPILSGWRPYLYDVAFQAYVLKLAYPALKVTPCLLLLDKTVPVSIDGMNTLLPVTTVGREVTVKPAAQFNVARIDPPILRLQEVRAEVAAILQHPIERPGTASQSFQEFVEYVSDTLRSGGSFPVRVGRACKQCQFYLDPSEETAAMKSGWTACMAATARKPVSTARADTVFGLHRLSERRLIGLLDTQPLKLADVAEWALEDDESEEHISSSQRRRLQWLEACGGSDQPFVLPAPLQEAMSAWRWPLHFIDFETCRPALPFHARRTPYDQILFQFSHHVLTEEGRLEHRTQCIEASPGAESSVPVLRALRAALSSDGGTVLHWWSHERTVVKEIREQIVLDRPSDTADLTSFVNELLGTKEIPGRFADLGMLIKRCVFYPGTGGSSSIKKVLPAVLRLSPSLRARYATKCYGTSELPSLNFKSWQWVVSDGQTVRDPYELLNPMFSDPVLQEAFRALTEDDSEEEPDFIKNGGAALVAYQQLQQPDLPVPERARLRNELFKYCELDTLAMVMVYQSLTGCGLTLSEERHSRRDLARVGHGASLGQLRESQREQVAGTRK